MTATRNCAPYCQMDHLGGRDFPVLTRRRGHTLSMACARSASLIPRTANSKRGVLKGSKGRRHLGRLSWKELAFNKPWVVFLTCSLPRVTLQRLSMGRLSWKELAFNKPLVMFLTCSLPRVTLQRLSTTATPTLVLGSRVSFGLLRSRAANTGWATPELWWICLTRSLSGPMLWWLLKNAGQSGQNKSHNRVLQQLSCQHLHRSHCNIGTRLPDFSESSPKGCVHTELRVAQLCACSLALYFACAANSQRLRVA